MGIEDMVREWAREQAPKPQPPALIIEALRDQAQFYTRENPFSVGDIVTPRLGATVKGAGTPHIVVAVNPTADYDFGGHGSGSTAYGRKHDIRVLCWTNGDWAPFWVEGSMFEPWVEPAAKGQDAPAADQTSVEARVSAVEAA